jgi:nitrate/nitrite transporter NarK
MFEDPEGKSYILTEGDSIGREHATISRIVNSEVIVTQRTFNYLGAESLLEKVISLPKDNDLDEGNTKKGAEPQRPGNPMPDAGGAGPGAGAAPGTGTGAGAGVVPGVIGAAGALGGLNLPAAVGALQGAIQQAAPPTDVDLNKAPAATPH